MPAASWLAVMAITSSSSSSAPSPGAHYRIEITTTRHYDRLQTDTSTFGGDYHAVAFVSVTRRDTTGGFVGHVVIDSVRCSGGGLYSMAYDSVVGAQSKGIWFDVPVVPGDRDVVPVPSRRNPVSNVVAEFLVVLFGPDRTPSKVGERWADTLNQAASTENYVQSGPLVRRWEVKSLDGGRAELDGDITGVVSASGRTLATGIIVGKQTLILDRGMLSRASINLSQQMMLAPPGAVEIRGGRGTTVTEIRRLD